LTPLLYAAREGGLDSARVLASDGTNLNITEPDGINPLITALINAQYDVAALLLKAGADPNIADIWGRTALYAAIDMHSLQPSATRPGPKSVDKSNGLDIARLALQRGANPNAQLADAIPGRSLSDDPDPVLRAGATPFIRASKTGDVAATGLLLEYGADSKIATKDGAADRGADRIIQFLADNGATIDRKDQKGLTPLDMAAGVTKTVTATLDTPARRRCFVSWALGSP
jgi:ankyrin repeat protein